MLSPMNDVHDLRLLLDSHVGLLVVESVEEPRVIDLFGRLLVHERRSLYLWSCTDGLSLHPGLARKPVHTDPDAVLKEIKAMTSPAVFLLLDFHPFLEDPIRVRLLKDIALRREHVPHTVVLVSHRVDVPPELRPYTARFHVSLPGTAKLEQIVREEARAWSRHHDRKVAADRATLAMLVHNLSGLTEADARRLARAAIWDDGAITAADLPNVVRAKQRLLDQGGAVAFEFDTARFADVGGLAGLKRWLGLRREAFFTPDDGLDPPRGVLLVGVQGGGKSLAAKATAGAWDLPLLRLDVGGLYNKFFGQTEQNLREALATAETMAPCVLWVDEIEKAVSDDAGNDGGTSRRLLGHLLTWMNERKEAVFIVATANEIDRLPPELIRKGRLDEIFFVDLPDAAVRAEIFDIHLRKRGLAVDAFDLEALADATEGFSGAEIEQAVVSARYLARESGAELTQAHVIDEVTRTQPLSVVMSEKVEWLRQWAADRTVPAN